MSENVNISEKGPSKMEADSTSKRWSSDSGSDSEGDEKERRLFRKYMRKMLPPDMAREYERRAKNGKLSKMMRRDMMEDPRMMMMLMMDDGPKRSKYHSPRFHAYSYSSPSSYENEYSSRPQNEPVKWTSPGSSVPLDAVPQTEPLNDRQVRNNAGGYTFEVTGLQRAARFLVLGSDGGTYYNSEKELGLQNARCIAKLIEEGQGTQVVKLLEDFAFRVAKQGPMILALAMCARNEKDDKTKKAAYKSLSKVCTTPTHLFMFLERCRAMSSGGKGWGRAHRNGVANWYLNYKNNPRKLAMHVTKYRQRNGWTHRDVLRMCHPRPRSDRGSEGLQLVFRYIVKGLEDVKNAYEEKPEEESVAMETSDVSPAAPDADVVELETDGSAPTPIKVGMSNTIKTADVDNITQHTDDKDAVTTETSESTPETMETSPAQDADNKMDTEESTQAPTKAETESQAKEEKTTTVDEEKKFDGKKSYFAQQNSNEGLLEYLDGVEQARKLQIHNGVDKMVSLIHKHRLVREHLPTEFLNKAEIWRALLKNMPLMATIRNLSKMSSLNMLSADSADVALVVKKLSDPVVVREAKVHPFSLLVSHHIYSAGRGHLGGLHWEPNPQVKAALEQAFYSSFKFVEPSMRRICIALDVSPSMDSGNVIGANCDIRPREAAAAMAMVTVRSEPNLDIVAFAGEMVQLNINKEMNLDEVIKETRRLHFGRTDCSLPMRWALNNKRLYDAFIIYTDNETWSGPEQPMETLKRYRQQSNIKNAKLIVVGLTSTGFTIADPEDPDTLDIVGFDSAAPEIIQNCILGKL